MLPLALSFHSPEALGIHVTGGKGANLARLMQAGLSVPPGLVLTAASHELFLAQAGRILDPVEAFAFEQPQVLEEQCQTLIRDLLQVSLPAPVIAALAEGLDALGVNAPVAVRSSATTEDMGGAAFAGQHDTFLNCTGLDDVADKVRRCWASLWSARAVAYRRAAGFDLRATRMAVVVQRMAFCEVAGVGFSLNPVTGNLEEQVIDANYGLGESVVGGEGGVDHFVVDATTGRVVRQSIASKELMVIARDNESGTQMVRIHGESRTQACLSPEQILAVSGALHAVEGVFGFPQDIEWGFERGELRLLQSRPITRIPPRWTRDESAERFPSVITPLAWALVEEGFHKSLNYSFGLMGVPAFRDKWFVMFDHYIYGNQNAVEIYADGAASNLRIGSLPQLIAAIPMLRRQYAWVLELPLTWTRDLDHYLMSVGELMAEPLREQTVAQLWKFVLRVKDTGADYFRPNIAISITQRTLYRVLRAILRCVVGDAEAAAVFDDLLAYCETKTGVINKELYRMARCVAEVPQLAARVSSSSATEFLEGEGFRSHPELQRAFDKFLRDHGHREVEFDPYHPTWVEAPWLVIENLKVMLESGRDDPSVQERELKIRMMKAESSLFARLPAEAHFFVREVIRLARVYTTLDDVEHYQTTRLTLPLRKGLRALGTKLSTMGVLDEPMDIFFADYAALDAAVNADDPDRWRLMRAAIEAEKGAYLQHREEAPVWERGRAAPTCDTTVGKLSGLPGSPGIAAGPVFKVKGREDFGLFPKGAILVARTTNPAWTPLFYKAAAVITESGGPLSHGAVTAREIGLPAVMSVRGALVALQNGQQVVVDGTAGQVRTEDAALCTSGRVCL